MPKSLLLIEDSPFVRGVYKTHFEKLGYIVHEAGDGGTGVVIAKTKRPDIIILDIIMPKLGGLGTLQELKDDYTTMEIPVIILTSAEREDEKEDALKSGAVAYILKSSTTPEELAEIVNKYTSSQHAG